MKKEKYLKTYEEETKKCKRAEHELGNTPFIGPIERQQSLSPSAAPWLKRRAGL